MAVIGTYKQGNCEITVHDDYIQPPEEVKRIIARVSRMVLDAEFRRQQEAKKKQSNLKEPPA